MLNPIPSKANTQTMDEPFQPTILSFTKNRSDDVSAFQLHMDATNTLIGTPTLQVAAPMVWAPNVGSLYRMPGTYVNNYTSCLYKNTNTNANANIKGINYTNYTTHLLCLLFSKHQALNFALRNNANLVLISKISCPYTSHSIWAIVYTNTDLC